MTSIEWLLSELEKVNYHPTEAMIMYAKKLEREQHGKTWDAALDAGQNRAWNVMRAYEDFDDWYAETFVSKGSDEVELPQQEISDEEIEKGAIEWYEKEGAYKPSEIALKTWVYAIRWYREQLKQNK